MSPAGRVRTHGVSRRRGPAGRGGAKRPRVLPCGGGAAAGASPGLAAAPCSSCPVWCSGRRRWLVSRELGGSAAVATSRRRPGFWSCRDPRRL